MGDKVKGWTQSFQPNMDALSRYRIHNNVFSQFPTRKRDVGRIHRQDVANGWHIFYFTSSNTVNFIYIFTHTVDGISATWQISPLKLFSWAVIQLD